MIRHWNKEDIELIEQIEKECFLVPWTLDMLISEYANPLYKCFIYEEQGRILGYIGFFVILGQIDIGNIAVKIDYRKKGIAKELVLYLLAFCKDNNIESINLEVRVSNIPAIKLYESFGFKKEGIRKNYYEGKEDAVIMWLRFNRCGQ